MYEHERRFSFGWILVCIARSLVGRKISIHELLWFCRQNSKWFLFLFVFNEATQLTLFCLIFVKNYQNHMVSLCLPVHRMECILDSFSFHFPHHFQIMWHRLRVCVCVCAHICSRVMQCSARSIQWKTAKSSSVQKNSHFLFKIFSIEYTSFGRLCVCVVCVCILMIFAFLNIFDVNCYPMCARALHFSS